MKGADPRPVRLLARLGVGAADIEGSGSSAFFLLVEEVFVEPFVVFVVFLFVVSVVFFVI